MLSECRIYRWNRLFEADNVTSVHRLWLVSSWGFPKSLEGYGGWTRHLQQVLRRGFPCVIADNAPNRQWWSAIGCERMHAHVILFLYFPARATSHPKWQTDIGRKSLITALSLMKVRIVSGLCTWWCNQAGLPWHVSPRAILQTTASRLPLLIKRSRTIGWRTVSGESPDSLHYSSHQIAHRLNDWSHNYNS